MKRFIPIYFIVLVVACKTSSRIEALPALDQSAKKVFYDHFNNWAKLGVLPYPNKVYVAEEQLPITIQISETGFMTRGEIILISNLKIEIETLLKKKKYSTPWLIIEFKSHTSNRLMDELFDFINQRNIRYKFI